MKTLHITNWYPTKENPFKAIWIKRHIESLSSFSDNNYVSHFEVVPNQKFKITNYKNSRNFNQKVIGLPTSSWFMIELICFLWLFYQLIIKNRQKEYDIINFHIAYPMLTYWHMIKRYIKKPIVVTEHWSAYHFNFGVKKNLPRIQRIFKQNIPVITVSKALAQDIKLFARTEFPNFILPNVVDESIFFHEKAFKKENFFFMVSQWKEPKDPFIVMKAFLNFNVDNKFKLKIGGYGKQWQEMEKWVIQHKAQDQIQLLGKLESIEIASYMQKGRAFLHPTNYETFSVVCAEATSCGASVIAPKIGGIPEVVGEGGILLDNWQWEDWSSAMRKVTCATNKEFSVDRRFTKYSVGKHYYGILSKIINDFKK